MKSVVVTTVSSSGRHAQTSVRPGSTRVMSPKKRAISSGVRPGTPAHVVGTQRLSEAARELVDANKATAGVPGRTSDEIARFFGDMTLVEPGLTDVWAWRPDDDTVVTTTDFMRILAGVARKD